MCSLCKGMAIPTQKPWRLSSVTRAATPACAPISITSTVAVKETWGFGAARLPRITRMAVVEFYR